MQTFSYRMSNFDYGRKNLLISVITRILLSFIIILNFAYPLYAQKAPVITPEEYSKLVVSLSEEGGYFRSDNWVTNERTYMEVIKPLQDLKISGGAYIGVASNQNLTYIAAVKPEIAFIVDIRHQNRSQHLVWKAIFEFAETPAEFLSLLFAKPYNPKNAPAHMESIDVIVNYFYQTSSDLTLFNSVQKRILDLLTKKYKFQFDARDTSEILYTLESFYSYNLNITNSGGSLQYNNRSPRGVTYADLLLMQTSDGAYGDPLAYPERYKFLRTMHLENRIIPITGDFTGTKAIAAIGQYLKDKNIPVSVYYTSNVEQYLFQNNAFNGWAENVRKLPLTDKSVFIRWISGSGGGSRGGFNAPGGGSRLQYIKIFLANYTAGKYYSYNDLRILDYIY
jgi:hypothetical protein